MTLRLRALSTLAFALLTGVAGAVACGPSVQSIYEGNVRFEHCYRLDLELQVSPTHRQACWVNWLQRYTYGQTRDRLEYARRRVRTGESATLDLSADPKQVESRQFYLVVPAPTSVHAPPPPIATRVNVAAEPPTQGAGEGGAGGGGPRAPGAACADACRSAFGSCSQACADDASSAACASCDPDYKKCMQRCFE